MICRKCNKITLNFSEKFCIKCGKGIINFGKYRNYTFMHVKTVDPKYCEWILDIPGIIPDHLLNFYVFLQKNI